MIQKIWMFAAVLLITPWLLAGCRDDADDDQSAQVILKWEVPTERIDGSPLPWGDIAGYTVHYGPTPDAHTESVTIDDPHTQELVLSDLGLEGNYYFTVSVVDLHGTEGEGSESVEVSF